jgi:hypothetical protein
MALVMLPSCPGKVRSAIFGLIGRSPKGGDGVET